MFVALRDQLEEPRRRRLVEFDVSEFVDNEQRHSIEVTLLMAWNAIKLREADLIEEVLSGEEVDTMTDL